MNKRIGMLTWLVAVLGVVVTGLAAAQEIDSDKPFAEAHVVLQLSDQEQESVVLDVANNLIKHYGGPDFVDIEIVTFGAGVRLLFAESQHESRIASLVENGVRFYICENTLDTMERTHGSRPKVSPHALSVQAGVARIVEQVGKGYILVRP